MIHPLLRLRLEPLDRRRRRLRSGLALIAVWVATFATGLVVSDVEEGSPADEAGLGPGDVIVEVNETPVRTLDEWRESLDRSKSRRRPIVLLLSRNGVKQEKLL